MVERARDCRTRYKNPSPEKLNEIIQETARRAEGGSFTTRDIGEVGKELGYNVVNVATARGLADLVRERFSPAYGSGSYTFDSSRPRQAEEGKNILTDAILRLDSAQLGGRTASVIDRSRRPGGIRHGGWSRKAPGR